MKTAIFLGAGASAAEGAPVQNALFKNFFRLFEGDDYRSSGLIEMHKELTNFFASVFNIHPERQDINSINFPTFEEALGVLDLSALRGESLRAFGHREYGPVDGPEDIFSGSNKVRLTRLYLILSMSKAIADSLSRARGHERPHRQLVASLVDSQLLRDTVFISANYDLLMDEALSDRFDQAAVDYGVEFAGPADYLDQVRHYGGQRISLLKIHGSLNWLYCPTCNNLKVFERKIVMELVNSPQMARCDYCHLVMSPVIVPPTYYKDMSNVFLSLIWNKAENALREVEHVVFCGYSFPDADMHIKYLLKRVQTNRPDPRSLKFTVVNNHSKKTEEEKKAERERYGRFLGGVDYRESSFQEFAADPRKFYRV